MLCWQGNVALRNSVFYIKVTQCKLRIQSNLVSGIEKALSKCLLLSLVIILQNSTLILGNGFQNLFVITLLKGSVMCLFVFFAHCIIGTSVNNHINIIYVGK